MLDARGGCLGGAVRYQVKAEPALVGICHCRDCQKFTGSAFSFLVAVPLAALEMEGTFKSFSKPGDSGQPITRRFCPECGPSISEEAFTRDPQGKHREIHRNPSLVLELELKFPSRSEVVATDSL